MAQREMCKQMQKSRLIILLKFNSKCAFGDSRCFYCFLFRFDLAVFPVAVNMAHNSEHS
jgi:hypothetical protein